MVKISNASNEIEIHRPFNEDSKIYFFAREAQILEEGWPENIRENGQKQGNLLLCKLESGQF